MLKRRVMDPVKLVLSIDSAIDKGSDYQKYAKTWDLQHLKCKPGEQFTVFTIRQLTDKQRDACYRGQPTVDQCTLAIKYGLIDVSNYMLEGPSGGELLPPPDRLEGENGAVVSDAWLERARFLVEEKMAVGAVILAITEARPPLS